MSQNNVNQFNFCPKCGSRSVKLSDGIKWNCPDCGFVLYNNVASAVGLILHDKENNVLFEVRNIEPGKGQLSLVGGFIDYDERAEAAVVRECMEEIGFNLTDAAFLCTQPNTYPYKNIIYKTCDVYFTSSIPDKFSSITDFIASLKKQESEVISLVSHKVAAESDVNALPIAFESAKNALKEFIKNKQNSEVCR